MFGVRFQNGKVNRNLSYKIYCTKRINFRFISTGLHETKLEIVASDAGAIEKKRSEVHNSVTTLDNIHSALENRGFKLNQTVKVLLPDISYRTSQRCKEICQHCACKTFEAKKQFSEEIYWWALGGKQENKILEMFPAELALYISEDDIAKV